MNIASLLFLILAALFFITIITAFLTFLVHMIAKRMKPEVHKAWPIGLVFILPLHTWTTAFAKAGSTQLAVHITISLWGALLVPLAIIWWRFDYWHLRAEKAVFGKEASALAAKAKAP